MLILLVLLHLYIANGSLFLYFNSCLFSLLNILWNVHGLLIHVYISMCTEQVTLAFVTFFYEFVCNNFIMCYSESICIKRLRIWSFPHSLCVVWPHYFIISADSRRQFLVSLPIYGSPVKNVYICAFCDKNPTMNSVK